MTDNHFRSLEDLYLSAPTNEYYAPEITVSEGEAEIRIPLKQDFFHAAHAVHGSVYFKAADDAAFFAANSLLEDVFVLTSSFSIELLKPVIEGVMVARGRVLHRLRSAFLAEARVFTEEGGEDDLIAYGTGRFVRSRIRLDESVGYR